MSCHARVRSLFIAGLPLIALMATIQGADAQSRLDASYALTVARLPMGHATASVQIGGGDYSFELNGATGGVLRVLSTGEGTMAARGLVTDGRPVPTSFSAKTKADDDAMDVTMTFENGNVKELTASEPPQSEDRVAVTDAQKQNVIDPLSALLVPGAESGEALSPPACERALPIFDGRRRFDLKLSFKRMDKVKADKGYAGPVLVCAMTFQPVAGHRASSSLMKFLSGSRDMEITLAPVAGTRVLAPFRIAINNMLGNMVVQASRFEISPSPVRASN